MRLLIHNSREILGYIKLDGLLLTGHFVSGTRRLRRVRGWLSLRIQYAMAKSILLGRRHNNACLEDGR